MNTAAPPTMLDFENLITNILERVQSAIPCEHAMIALLDDAAEILVAYRSIGPGPADGEELTSIQHGIIGWVARTGEVALVPDVHADERYIMLHEGTQSELAAPMRIGDDILGVFNVESYTPNAYSQEHITLLSALADQAALSLHTAKLYNNLEASYGALRVAYSELSLQNKVGQIGSEPMRYDETLPDMLREILDFAEADQVVIALWDNDTSKTIQTTIVGADFEKTITDPSGDHLLTRELLKSHQPRILTNLKQYEFSDAPHLRNMHHALGMPLLARGNDMGALFLFREETPFTEKSIERLTATVNYLALSLDNRQLFINVTRRLRETELLQTIAGKASSTLNFDMLLKDVAEHILLEFPVDVLAVWMLERGTGQLILADDIVYGVQSLSQLPTWSLESSGIIATVYHYNTTFHSENLATDERVDHPEIFVDNLGLTHAIAAPIYSSRGTDGVIFIGSQNKALTTDHLKTLTAVGGQLGVALSNARLYVSERKRANLMQRINQLGAELTAILELDELIKQVVVNIQTTLNYENVFLLMRSGNGLRVRAQATQQGVKLVDDGKAELVTQGAVGRAIRTMRSYLIRDLELDPDSRPPYVQQNARSELVLPVRSGHRILGALDILSSEPNAFDDSDREAMETLATQVAIAIENARLYAETQKRLNEQQVIHYISRDLNAILDIPRLADATVYQMAHALNVTGCLFALYDNEQDALLIRALYVGPEAKNRDTLSNLEWHQPLNTLPSSFRTMLAMRNPVNIQATDSGAAEQEYQLLQKWEQQAALLVPMVATGRPLGVIIWFDDRKPREFMADEVRLAQTLANQAAVALERARLHEETQRQLKRETLLRRVAETANNWLEMDSMVNKFAHEACQALQAPLCVIYTFTNDSLHAVGQHHMPGTQSAEGLITQLNVNDYPHVHDALDSGEVIRCKAEEESPEGQRLTQVSYHISMLCPLISRGRLVGALEVLDDRATHQYTTSDIELIKAVSSPISIALDNANLFTQLEDRAEELEEANRLKSEFLANISHELRTPMNSIIGFTSALSRGMYGDITNKQADRLSKVERNAHHLLDLINDLLDISKIEAGRLDMIIADVDATEMLKMSIMAVEPQIQRKNIQLQQDIAPNLPPIRGDEQRVRQIFTNLLSNAVKFTDEGSIRVKAFQEDEHVHISFTDTGIGIAPEDQHVIFDEFRQVDGSATRQYEGTGLGLAICHKLVLMLNGDIWVESEPGAGSTFHVLLPRKEALND